jgi:hypothetical protein
MRNLPSLAETLEVTPGPAGRHLPDAFPAENLNLPVLPRCAPQHGKYQFRLGGSMKGDVKNKLLPQRRQEIFLEIQPPTWPPRESAASGPRSNWSRSRLRDVESFRFHRRVINCVAERFHGVKPSGLCWQPGFYLRLEAYGFMGLSEGAYSLSRDSVPKGTLGLTAELILSLEPGRRKGHR